MNQNEIRSLALERVVKALEAACFDVDGPLFGGLKDDEIYTIGDEISRIINGIKAESATNPTPTMVWEVVCGALPNYSWWEWFRFSEGADWETPGTLTVTSENPNGGRSITKHFEALDLLHTYLAMEQKTHCGGCDMIADPDICSSDLILQHAMFGEVVYG